nr:molybdopterin molybdotransferase MoeA [Allocatelliglobosispora scoriae]
MPVDWASARATVHDAATAVAVPAVAVPLERADGLTLAEGLVARTPLPAFATSSVDGWAGRGPQPWRIVGRVLAGSAAPDLAAASTAVEIATGAMVPAGTEAILRTEHGTLDGEFVSGAPRGEAEWRLPGDEADLGEVLFAPGVRVSPGLIGLAASCGYDELIVRERPVATVLVFGDELLDTGLPGEGRVRDALGPSLPAALRRLGAECDGYQRVEDTLAAHVKALQTAAASGAALICTTGGTMNGPVDHLHPALAELGATYVVNTVAVRPGFPMLVAELPSGQLIAGLPGNPQSAMVALVSLVAPLVAGLTGRKIPAPRRVILGAPVSGRGAFTHLALVRIDERDGLARPVEHVGSSMLRGLAGATGFAVIPPGRSAKPGDLVDLVELP